MSLVKEVANSIYKAYINYDTGVPFGIDEARAAINALVNWLETSDDVANKTTEEIISRLKEEAVKL